MSSINLNINGKSYTVDVDPKMPLLWVLRDELGLTGTKYGCGVSSCGACTVLINDRAGRSCQLPVESCATLKITTIEGLSEDGSHPVQKAWEEVGVPQCGYCQAGQIMNTVGLLNMYPAPTDDQVNAMMSGNICRCGCYHRIKKAIHIVVENANKNPSLS